MVAETIAEIFFAHVISIKDTILECKSLLPMPELWGRFGLDKPAGFPKSFRSVFREDKDASASVFQIGRLWFFKDHATGESFDEIGLIQRHTGCDKSSAIKAYHELAGVTMPERSLRAQTSKRDWGRVVAIYDYRDPAGNLVHQTVRYDPKRFSQRRPAAPDMRVGNKRSWRDPNGNWWIGTLEGIEPVLYRLPELLANPDKPVVICEGEKDADELAAREPMFCATTSPMGAGKWRTSYTEALSGRDVIIAMDRDTAGIKSVDQVASSLRSTARTVKVLNWSKLWPSAASDPARKLDIYDFLAGITVGRAA